MESSENMQRALASTQTASVTDASLRHEREPMFGNLRRDARRYHDNGGWLAHPGFWIGAVYRFGMWGQSLRSRVLRAPLWLLYRLLQFPISFFFNVQFWVGPHGARIGPGLCLIHPRNILIGSGVEIGADSLIFHEVTIGTGPAPGKPKLGDHVDVYTGARVLGGIAIGDHCLIGANCVVTKSVPAGSVVLSVPTRVIPRSLSVMARAVDQRDTECT